MDYLAAFNLKCVALSPTGRVYVSRNPAGASMAWWARADDADKIATAARNTGDIPEAARRLQIAVTPHVVVAKRTADRTAKIDKALKQALDEGTLKIFNAEYRRRRLAAQQAGRRFMSYSEAHTRLHKCVADMVAGGGVVSQSFVVQVFNR
jgi:hypothetical protein